jgi:hypothetical protein
MSPNLAPLPFPVRVVVGPGPLRLVWRTVLSGVLKVPAQNRDYCGETHPRVGRVVSAGQ